MSCRPGGGGECLYSQHSGGKDRRIFVSSRPVWSTRASSRINRAIEKPCLKKQNKTNKQKNKKERKKKDVIQGDMVLEKEGMKS